MANFYSDNAQLIEDVPSTKSKANETHGSLRVIYDEITFAAELTTSDVLKMMKIPAGAKIYDVEINCPDLGTTGTFDIGWAASADGGEVADPNGLYAALVMSGAGGIDRQKYVNSVGGFNKEFSEEVEVQIVASTSTDVATGVKLQIAIYYSVN